MTITIFRTLMLFGLSVLVGSLTSYPTLATTDYGFTGKLHYNIVSILARFYTPYNYQDGYFFIRTFFVPFLHHMTNTNYLTAITFQSATFTFQTGLKMNIIYKETNYLYFNLYARQACCGKYISTHVNCLIMDNEVIHYRFQTLQLGSYCFGDRNREYVYNIVNGDMDTGYLYSSFIGISGFDVFNCNPGIRVMTMTVSITFPNTNSYAININVPYPFGVNYLQLTYFIWTNKDRAIQGIISKFYGGVSYQHNPYLMLPAYVLGHNLLFGISHINCLYTANHEIRLSLFNANEYYNYLFFVFYACQWPTKYLTKEDKICWDVCPRGYYQNEYGLVCEACPNNCLICDYNSYECEVCESYFGYVLYKKLCYRKEKDILVKMTLKTNLDDWDDHAEYYIQREAFQAHFNQLSAYLRRITLLFEDPHLLVIDAVNFNPFVIVLRIVYVGDLSDYLIYKRLSSTYKSQSLYRAFVIVSASVGKFGVIGDVADSKGKSLFEIIRIVAIVATPIIVILIIICCYFKCKSRQRPRYEPVVQDNTYIASNICLVEAPNVTISSFEAALYWYPAQKNLFLDGVCPICLTYGPNFSLTCGHMYCRLCINACMDNTRLGGLCSIDKKYTMKRGCTVWLNCPRCFLYSYLLPANSIYDKKYNNIYDRVSQCRICQRGHVQTYRSS